MDQKRTVVVLGSTGSIGVQTLDIASKESDKIEIVGLAAYSSYELVCNQAQNYSVDHIVLVDDAAAEKARSIMPDSVRVTSGLDALLELIDVTDADVVVNALVGSVGLRASLHTLKAGKRLALANKESLVVGGALVMPLVQGDNLIPVDSEHSALYQCLLGEMHQEVDALWLTASGGPFRLHSKEQLAVVTRDQALKHPTWTMGPKITIDSSTLMNKGLEVIEAYHLFGVDYDRIKVVVHPQSCIHSMVAYCDGSIKAHLGVTDMRIPIQYALSYPERWSAPLPALDFTQLSDLTFEAPDFDKFPSLQLAYDAGRAGGTSPVVLNAANEIGVEFLLRDEILWGDIARIVDDCLGHFSPERVESVEHIERVDAETRARARSFAASLH